MKNLGIFGTMILQENDEKPFKILAFYFQKIKQKVVEIQQNERKMIEITADSCYSTLFSIFLLQY